MIFADLPRRIAQLDDLPGQDEISHLPQFYRADLDMCWRLGGPFVRRILNAIGFASRWKYLSVDSRSHMLMKGMYPCIPGWHCDDFHRVNGMPDLERVATDAPSDHAAIIVGDCSRTTFLNSAWEYRPRSFRTGEGKLVFGGGHGETIYGNAHQAIVEKLRDRELEVRIAEPGELLWFSPLTWHRGSPADQNGWRFFLRVTGSNHREPQNELRTQTQVYMTEPFAGW